MKTISQRQQISRGSTAIHVVAARLEHKKVVVSTHSKHQETFSPAVPYNDPIQKCRWSEAKQKKGCLQASPLSPVNSHLGSLSSFVYGLQVTKLFRIFISCTV